MRCSFSWRSSLLKALGSSCLCQAGLWSLTNECKLCFFFLLSLFCSVCVCVVIWRTTRSVWWREEPFRTSGCWKDCKYDRRLVLLTVCVCVCVSDKATQTCGCMQVATVDSFPHCSILCICKSLNQPRVSLMFHPLSPCVLACCRSSSS